MREMDEYVDSYELDRICELFTIIGRHKKAIELHEQEIRQIVCNSAREIDSPELFKTIEWYKTKINGW